MIVELFNFTSGISDEWEEAIGKVNKCLDSSETFQEVEDGKS